jgi:hypothetical protein
VRPSRLATGTRLANDQGRPSYVEPQPWKERRPAMLYAIAVLLVVTVVAGVVLLGILGSRKIP